MKYLVLIFVAFGLLLVSPQLSDSQSKSKAKAPAAEEFIKVDKEPMVDMGLLQKNVIYPESARKNNIQGKVMVRALVDKKGKVLRTEIETSVNKDLDQAAVKAIKKSKFAPAMKDNKPVKFWVTIPVMFKLK